MTTVADLIRELGKYPADAPIYASYDGDPSVGIGETSFLIGDDVQYDPGEFGETKPCVIIRLVD